MDASSITFFLNKLENFCSRAPTEVEVPYLFQETNPLDIKELFKPIGVGEFHVITEPKEATVLNSNLMKIGVTPIVLSKALYVDKNLIVSYEGQVRHITVKEDSKIIDVHFDTSIAVHDSLWAAVPESTPMISNPEAMDGLGSAKTDNANTWIWFAVGLLFLLVAFIAIQVSRQRDYHIYDGSESSSVGLVDPVEVVSADSVTLPIMPRRDTSVIRMEASLPTLDESFTKSNLDRFEEATVTATQDDRGLTGWGTFRAFLKALDTKDCFGAWNLTYNQNWEAKGQEWFCSSQAFGAIREILLGESYVVKEDSLESEVSFEYYVQDNNGVGRCFKQVIKLQKLRYENNLDKWMIVEIRNKIEPFECIVNDINFSL